ncbi:threonine ammonia-lyase [Amorphus orientalis]|uniref:Threonine dehydratase n=1 Tax=Amorphus orientalis TaxID=649198 RepID=A0AAE4AV21_9HYPH|nr:threonine/serine dehydratase [Amorphus orientalis]MDQ0317787.1 threonine dehydratase [Amorphus orientalis]
MSSRPDLDDIRRAADGLRGQAIRTPLLENDWLNQHTGGRVLIKPEALQRTGSFKFRGAYTKISRLTPSEREKGVVAYSSGNHAQGVAYAARIFGIPATIVMPSNAPRAKIDGTKRYGGRVVLYDRATEDRAAIAAAIVEETGATLVRPFDDPDIIAGQGTVGLEIMEDAATLGLSIDLVIVPAGGGGLTAGTATAVKALSPATEIWSAEPADFDDTARSLAAGERLGNAPGGHSICDALLSPMPGEITFEINRRLLAGGLTASDEEAEEAMRVAFDHLKVVLEPGGAIALAAVLAGRIELAGRTCVIVASGGNTDLQHPGRASAAA